MATLTLKQITDAFGVNVRTINRARTLARQANDPIEPLIPNSGRRPAEFAVDAIDRLRPYIASAAREEEAMGKGIPRIAVPDADAAPAAAPETAPEPAPDGEAAAAASLAEGGSMAELYRLFWDLMAERGHQTEALGDRLGALYERMYQDMRRELGQAALRDQWEAEARLRMQRQADYIRVFEHAWATQPRTWWQRLFRRPPRPLPVPPIPRELLEPLPAPPVAGNRLLLAETNDAATPPPEPEPD